MLSKNVRFLYKEGREGEEEEQESRKCGELGKEGEKEGDGGGSVEVDRYLSTV